MSFEINDQVKHNKYGLGIIKKDVTEICRDNEVLVTFDESLPFLKPNYLAGNSGSVGETYQPYVNTDIVSIKDLELIKKSDKAKVVDNYDNYIGTIIRKISGCSFKSGLKTETPVAITENPNTKNIAFEMNDGSIVDIFKCKDENGNAIISKEKHVKMKYDIDI